MNQAEHVISKFKTQDALAVALGCRQSVIAGWKRRGFVPAQQQPKVLQAAKIAGIDLTPEDFFTFPESPTDLEAEARA